MPFEIVGEITQVETICGGHPDPRPPQAPAAVRTGAVAKLKGIALVRLRTGRIRKAELHWYEAHGIGRKEIKRSSGSGMSSSRRHRPRRPPPRFVVCVENDGYPASLELHKIYRTVPDTDAARDGDVRIVDESGEDYLYPAEWFAAVELPRRVKSSLIRRSA